MTIEPVTFIFQIINFALLVWLLNKVLYGPILSAINKREATYAQRRELLDSEESQLKEALLKVQTQEREFTSRVEGAEEELRRDMEALRKSETERVKSEIADLEQRWHSLLEERREEDLKEVKESVGQLALELTRRVTRELFEDTPLEESVLDRLLKSIPQEQSQEECLVRSARPLSSAQQDKLKLSLPKAEFEVDPELLAGLEVICDGVVYSFHIRSFLQAMEQELRQVLTLPSEPT